MELHGFWCTQYAGMDEWSVLAQMPVKCKLKSSNSRFHWTHRGLYQKKKKIIRETNGSTIFNLDEQSETKTVKEK